MDVLRWAAYGMFGLAAVALAVFVFDGFWPPFFGVAISLALSALLLLAMDKGLQLLADIRDAMLRLIPEPVVSVKITDAEESSREPTKSMAELSGEIDQLKAKQ